MMLIDHVRQLGFKDVKLDDPPNATVLANDSFEIAFGGFPPHQSVKYHITKSLLGSWAAKKPYPAIAQLIIQANDPDLFQKVADFLQNTVSKPAIKE